MKRSELKEMIKQAMLGEDARTDAEQEGYEDGFKDAKDDIKDKLKDMKVSEADLDEASQPKTKFDVAKMFGVDIEDIEDDNGNFIVTGDQDEMNTIARENGLNPEDVEGHSIRIYTESQLEEADEDKDEEIESEEEISVEDELEVEATPEVSGDTAEVQDHLEAALEAAIAMGDDKLATQIKNTQIYLTRSQTVSEEDTVEEDLYENRRMLKIAGIIK